MKFCGVPAPAPCYGLSRCGNRPNPVPGRIGGAVVVAPAPWTCTGRPWRRFTRRRSMMAASVSLLASTRPTILRSILKRYGSVPAVACRCLPSGRNRGNTGTLRPPAVDAGGEGNGSVG